MPPTPPEQADKMTPQEVEAERPSHRPEGEPFPGDATPAGPMEAQPYQESHPWRPSDEDNPSGAGTE